MTHTFELKPDLSLLKECGYLKSSKDLMGEIMNEGGQLKIEIPSISTSVKGCRNERDEIDKGLKYLTQEYNIESVYDTLIFICLTLAGEYHSRLINQFEGYINSIALKQLATFHNALEEWKDVQSITIKSTEKGKQVIINHPELIQWLPKILAKGVYSSNVFVQGTRAELNLFFNKDWGKLQQITPRKYKSIKGKNQMIFITKVLDFIRNHTQISAKKSAKLYKSESKFIYETGRILHVFEKLHNEYAADAFIRSILKYNKTATHNLKS